MIPGPIIARIAIQVGTLMIQAGVKRVVPEITKLLDEPEISEILKDLKIDKVLTEIVTDVIQKKS